MDLRQELIKYSNKVLKDEVMACEKHKQACQRFLNDIEKEGTKEFPYIFDEKRANRFLRS